MNNDSLKLTFNLPSDKNFTHYIISRVEYENLMNACKSTIVKPVITDKDKAHNIEAHAIIATLNNLEPVKFI